MTVINNATLILKDSKGNEGTIRSVTDNDIVKIRNSIADIGKLVDPVSHLPIKATATTVGVVQLADDEAIAAGTTGRVVDAKQLQDAVMGVTPANCVTNVAAGSTANKIKVTKDDYTTTITIDNVEHSSFADQATHAVNADNATHATQADTAASANSVAWDNVSDKPSSYTPASHTHDDRYYTESEIDAKLTDYLHIAGGNVTGNLTVQNKNVVRSINGVNADAEGNINVARPVVDYTSGIDIAYRHAGEGAFPRVTIPQDGLMVLYGFSWYSSTEEAYTVLRIVNGDTAIFAQAANQPVTGASNLFAAVNLPVRKGQQVECAVLGDERICRLYPYAME